MWGLIALGLLLASSSGKKGAGSQAMIRPVPGKITSPYGPRVHPVTGEKGKMHYGIDMTGATGTPIKAAYSGIVSSKYYNDIGGNQLIIKHPNGYSTGYSHLNKYFVNQGDEVVQGQIIGEVGKTGRVTGPHLHFSMKDSGGNFVDPAKFLPAA
jgi:murein DD-endopeptidase MepM/ murein hydrolase activator NlpD